MVVGCKADPEADGTYETPDRKERSYYTMHLYLNDETSTEVEPLIEGGATRFENLQRGQFHDVVPKAGRVLIFQHRDLLHSGADVVKGTKYTLRTDILYTKEYRERERERDENTIAA